MQITSLDLLNFRNYDLLNMEFSPAANIIFGENGQGKTNILEAVFLCGLGRSMRKVHDTEMILLSEEESHVKGNFINEDGSMRIDVHLKKNGKKGIAINRLPIKKLSELFGKLNIVVFSPEDLEIVKKNPGVRRSFLNTELCQTDMIYTNELITYSRILKQRGELLKKLDAAGNFELEETLDIWDLQLSECGKKIIEMRRQFIEELNDLILDIHYDISGKREKLKIVYEPSVDEDRFYEELLRTRDRDKYYKNTSLGPHRDDMRFFVDNKDLKIYGSQGQQRTCVLSLKLAELKIIENKTRKTPVLLLDDVLSELDRNRQKELLKRIGKAQTIITCTGMDEFVENEIKDAKKFYIKNAKIEEI